MNTQKLLNIALDGIDTLGYRLDQYGITGKVNRHNIAAFLAAEQKHLEGELAKVNGDTPKKEEKKKDASIITLEDLDKDLQLKEAVGIAKALQIMKGN